MTVTISSAALYRLYLARERLREGLALQNDASPLARMKGILALDDAVELIVVTLLPLLSIKPKRDASLAELLDNLVKARPALGSHSGPVERLRRLRDRVKHDGIVPSPEDLRLNAVEAESFARAAVPATTGLTLEETSPLDAVEQEDLKAHLANAKAGLDEGDYPQVCIEASQAFALGRRRFEFKVYGRDVVDVTVDDFIGLLSSACRRARYGTDNSDFARAFESALSDERYAARRMFARLLLPSRLARMGIDMAELERFEHLTPHVNVESQGEWCEVLMTRELDPSKDDASFVLDFATRSLLGLQDRLARRATEG